ncbi:MAG: hypothetical protein ALAOOOJD_04603 [bacterium]|nr:hypothetical protein [bacterium]
MKLRFIAVFLLIFALVVTLAGNGVAKDAPNANKVAKTKGTLGRTGAPTYGMLNVNNWQYFMEFDGRSGVNPFHDGNGGVFPRGTSNVIFQDGFVFGARLTDTRTGLPPTSEPIRVGGQTYNTGTVAGAVISGVPESPDNGDVRLYRIRRDINDVGLDLTGDASEFYEKAQNAVTAEDIAAVRAQYLKDWDEWPVQKGAPYVDRNKNGQYDKPPAGLTSRELITGNYDEPGVVGADPNSPADQVMWTVCNDFNEAASRGLYGAAPIGVEIQITAWAYKRSDALGNVVFQKYRMINRGFFRSDSFYVCKWSDPDLGDSGDDFAGCDVSLAGGKSVSLGYIYNSNSVDNQFRNFSIPPPAGGYDFFQGPLVQGEATDVGIFDLKKRPGYTNLGMSSFNFFSAGSAISDPPLTQYEGTLRWFKMLRGYVADPSTGVTRKWIDPDGNETNFPLSGDPVAKTGWIDGSSTGTPAALPPGDRRILLVSGPFAFAPGDTQEVVVGIVGGLGADRLSSVSVMKFSDRFAQNTYDALFVVPSAPRAPNVAVRQLDGEIVLEWGSDLNNVSLTETSNAAPYVFQGYNVYQFPSRNSTLTDGRRIATYDVVDEVTVVLDDQFDANSGQILRLPVQLGANSGVTRYIRVASDAISGRANLRNGQEYYFGVTAYSVSTDPAATPLTLESTPVILPVVPQSPKPGVRYDAPFGKAIDVAHSTGVSGGAVTATVVDPGKATGANYKVTFRNNAEGVLEWVLNRNNQAVFSSTNQGPIVSGDDNDTYNYPTIDGMYVTVTGAPEGMKSGFDGDADQGWHITSGARRWTWSGAAWGLEGFEGAMGWDEPSHYFGVTAERSVKGTELNRVLLKLAPTDVNGNWDPNHPDVSYAYRYLRGATAAPAKPEFAPFIINKTGGYAYQDFTKGVPFAAYNMDVDPPQRLAVAFFENNVAAGLVDGKYWPGDFNTTNNNTTREFGFILKAPYSETPNPAFQIDILNNALPVMYWLAPNRRGNIAYDDADEFEIYPHRPNTTNDVFEFKAPGAADFNATVAKTDVNKINVFPNPYYALNAAETNRFVRFVTFNFLPAKATIRIFNIGGQLVRTIEKNDDSQFIRWDLNNQSNFPVAGGMYIVHIDMPELGATKVLKLGVIPEQQVLDVF